LEKIEKKHIFKIENIKTKLINNEKLNFLEENIMKNEKTMAKTKAS